MDERALASAFLGAARMADAKRNYLLALCKLRESAATPHERNDVNERIARVANDIERDLGLTGREGDG